MQEFNRVRDELHRNGMKMVPYFSPYYYSGDDFFGEVRRALDEYKVDGLYLDQLGSAFNGLCLDPTHGHPLGGGTHVTTSARACFEEVRERVGWRVPVLSEASSEENIDISAGKIIHYNIWPGFVPAFSAVYHDYWSFYGRTAGGNADDMNGFMNIGMIFAIGGQIGRIWPGRLPNALKGETKHGCRPQAIFLKRLIEARRTAAKFMRYGEMLRPLELVGKLPNVQTHMWRGNRRMSRPVVMPAVISSVWRAGDGEVGIVLVNMTDKPLAFEGRFAPTDYALGGGFTSRMVVGKGLAVNAQGRVRATVPAHDVQIAALRKR